MKRNLFLKRWKKENRKALQQMYPDISRKEIDIFLDDIIKRYLKNPTCTLDNNYINQSIKTNLLDLYDWLDETKPICAGFGVLYKNQHQVLNPLAVMIQKFLTSRKAFKGMLKKIHDKASYEYKTYDRKQLSEKIMANSIYGSLGNLISFLFNRYTAPSVTGTGQSLISTTEQAFESFLENNSLFNSLNECITFMNNVIKEKYDIDSGFLRDVTEEELIGKLIKTFYLFKDSYLEPLEAYVAYLTQDQMNRIYYKNNLYEFTKHPEIIGILVKIIRNTKEFKDPNAVPESSKEYMEELWRYYRTFVFYNHSPINRIQRLKNDKRKNVITIDTDSNFINLNPWTEFIFENVINPDYTCDDRDREELRFIVVNTMAFVITNMMKDVLNKYTADANIPKDFRNFINIKNEFLMSRVILSSKKKKYISSIRLREGDEIYPEKVDIKGLEFIKSTATQDTQARFKKILKSRMLEQKNIDMTAILADMAEFESDIINSLRNGDKTYLIPKSVNEFEAYKEPLREQGVRAIIAWNYIYPDMEITLPAKVDVVKLLLTDEYHLNKLKHSYPDIYKIVEKDILNNVDKRISSKALPVIAIPRNVDTIPEWMIEFIDYDTISYNVLKKFYPLLNSLKLKTITVSKKEYFSNIIDI